TLPGHRLAEYRMIRKDGSICRVSDNLRSTRLSDGTLCVFGVATDVTHQYETYAHLKQLTDALPGGFAIYEISSSEIQTLYFSDGICDLMGCTRNEYVELTTQGPQEIIFAADWPTLEDKINNLLDGACAIDCSYRIHTKDGGFRWLNSFGTVTQRQGDRVKINVVVLDITQLRESEEKLRISNEETRVAMAQMGKMICRYDFFTDTLTMPQVYAQKYGFGETIVSLKEHNPQDVLAPQMQETFTSFYQSLLNGDPSGSVDLYAQTVDGEWCWEHVEFVNIFDTQGLPLKAILSTEDITEEKKRESEQELIRENQELFQIVASHSDRHIVKLDIPQRTAYTQPHTAEVFGVDTIIPNMPDTLLQLGHISEESVNSYMNFYHRLISGEPRVQENLKIKRAKSSDWGWYRFDGTVISDDQHHPLSAVISFEDITDRYEKDIAYARLNTKMQKIPEETMLYYEVDLTRMVIEREEGSMLDALRLPSDQNLREMSTGAIEEFVHPQDRAAFYNIMGRRHFLAYIS
ncbi:MAG: PAS domain-containing protein, partial [Anaerovoracaceae bacterium]